MNENLIEGAAKLYGPYSVINYGGPEGISFLSLPFAAVAGCQLFVAVEDNAENPVNEGDILTPAEAWPLVEVSIWGGVQGYSSCIKRQAVRLMTGPMSYVFPYELAYDQVTFRARNMSGGSRRSAGTWSAGTNGTPTLSASVYVQPRTGFGPAGRNKGAF